MTRATARSSALWETLPCSGFSVTDRIVRLGSLSVTEISLRNRSFIVRDRADDGRFVRQHADSATSYEVAPLVRDSRTFRELAFERPAELLERSAQLGVVVGRLHRDGSGDVASVARESPVQALRGLIEQRVQSFSQLTAADIELVKILQRHDEFLGALVELSNGWHAAVTAHHDLTWDNVLVSADASEPTGVALTVIDWETAGIGDPDWDVGTVFADFIVYWLSSIPLLAGESPAASIALASRPMSQIRPAINAFWSGYTRVAEIYGTTVERRLHRATGYAGARLIQTAFEHTSTLSILDPFILLLLQVSMNVMQNPERTAERLFGIPPLDRTPS